MRYSRLVNLVLLLTIPSLVAYPQLEVPVITIHFQKTSAEIGQTHNDFLYSYDDILNLIEQLESGGLENRCSDEDLNRINQFLATLAKEGVLPNDIQEELILENDIHELLEEVNSCKYTFLHIQENECSLVPMFYYNEGEVLLCRS